MQQTLNIPNDFAAPASFPKFAIRSVALFGPHPIPGNARYVRPTSCRASGNPPEVQTVALHDHELLAHRDVDAPFLQNASRRLKTVRADARLGCSHRGRVPSWLVVRRIVRSRVAVHIMIQSYIV